MFKRLSYGCREALGHGGFRTPWCVPSSRIAHVFESPDQGSGTLSRLQTAHKQLVGSIHQLRAERDLAQPGSNWQRNLDQLIHRLETDDELLFGLAEETLARLNRRSGT